MNVGRIGWMVALGLGIISSADADILYLKNGHRLEGFVSQETKEALGFQVAGGIVVFNKAEVDRVEYSSPGDADRIRAAWQKEHEQNAQQQKQLEKQREQSMEEWRARKARELEQYKTEEEYQRQMDSNTRIVQMVPDKDGHLFVDAVLNESIPATMVVDTGAPMSLITAEVGRQLGMDLDRMRSAGKVMVLNGEYEVAKVTLKSVALGALREESVVTYVLLKDNPDVTKVIRGGLLGMSFMERFHFAVNRGTNQMLLYRIDAGSPGGASSLAVQSDIRATEK